jgi:hypothetical protein
LCNVNSCTFLPRSVFISLPAGDLLVARLPLVPSRGRSCDQFRTVFKT